MQIISRLYFVVVVVIFEIFFNYLLILMPSASYLKIRVTYHETFCCSEVKNMFLKCMII